MLVEFRWNCETAEWKNGQGSENPGRIIVVIPSIMADILVTQAISLSVFPGSKTILRKRCLMKLFRPF